MNSMSQWFWSLTALACIVWYSTITFLVAYRGALDIRGMLKRLRDGQEHEDWGAPGPGD